MASIVNFSLAKHDGILIMKGSVVVPGRRISYEGTTASSGSLNTFGLLNSSLLFTRLYLLFLTSLILTLIQVDWSSMFSMRTAMFVRGSLFFLRQFHFICFQCLHSSWKVLASIFRYLTHTSCSKFLTRCCFVMLFGSLSSKLLLILSWTEPY